MKINSTVAHIIYTQSGCTYQSVTQYIKGIYNVHVYIPMLGTEVCLPWYRFSILPHRADAVQKMNKISTLYMYTLQKLVYIGVATYQC
jgi:hypothetical protein